MTTTTFQKDPEKYYVMGTGSRSMRTHPQAQQIWEHLVAYVEMLREQHPNIVLISGMAEGWDEAIARTAIRLDIPFIAALPNSTYGEYYWGTKSVLQQNRLPIFQQLVQAAQEVVIVCDRIVVNGTHSNFIRNQWMVTHCDHALVYEPTSSGTRDAVGRLRQAGKSYDTYPFQLQQTLEI